MRPGDPAAVRALLRAALAATTERLSRAGVPSPSADARHLISAAAGTDRPLILLDTLPPDFEDRLEAVVVRREAREPVQLILGRAPFRRLSLRVRPGVFVPRPETELAIDLALDALGAPPARAVDLCTGSGALAAALRDEYPATAVLAVDVDPVAVALAGENLAALPGDPAGAAVLRADLGTDPEEAAARDLGPSELAEASRSGDGETLLSRLRPVDLVLANPPYIPAGAVPRDPEVLLHDPDRALFGGGEDGLDLPRRVLVWARHLLRPGGLLVMEHADVQGRSTRELAAEVGGFTGAVTRADLTGRDRFLLARRTGGTEPAGHGPDVGH